MNEKEPRFDYYYLNKEEDLLFSSDLPIWTDTWGKFHKISAEDALQRFGIDTIRECEELS